MRAMDWAARTVMLVLAALATLALIGSLASVSDSRIGDAFPGQVAAPAEPVSDLSRPATPSDPRVVEPGMGTMTIETTRAQATPPPVDRDMTRWLKALTYAVLALAAVAAAGVVALVRIGSRIADR